jgi:hypothetical protein
MTPLSDDELSSLLEQAKSKPPEPRPELAVRALRAYQAKVARRSIWRRLLLGTVPIPLPVGVLSAVFLLLIGVAAGRSCWRPSVVIQTRRVEVPVMREQIIYRDCPAGPREANPPIASLTFKDFQPVRQIRPRLVRSIRDDQ